jgi:hypothetical protein
VRLYVAKVNGQMRQRQAALDRFSLSGPPTTPWAEVDNPGEYYAKIARHRAA